MLRKWVKEFGSDPAQAFPGHGQMKPEQQEIERLKNRLDGLSSERETLESQIRTASSRARLGSIAEQRLKLTVATGSQLVFLPRKSSRDTP